MILHFSPPFPAFPYIESLMILLVLWNQSDDNDSICIFLKLLCQILIIISKAKNNGSWFPSCTALGLVLHKSLLTLFRLMGFVVHFHSYGGHSILLQDYKKNVVWAMLDD